jgi:carotenoid cleavage dioxygenase-like enzyme
MHLNLLYLFINPFLSNEYAPVKNEIKKNIVYKLPENKKNIIKKINGFYGQIGPNPKYYNENYHLFDGDGMIHGIFFDNGNLTYNNHWIKTDKLNFENKFNFKIPISMSTIKKKEIIFLSFIYKFLELLKIVPNFMGTANTALWKNNNKIYALHERDKPYEIDINFKNKNIETLQKIDLENIEYFTAHPRKDLNNIYVASYDNFKSIVRILKYDKNLSLIKYKDINTKYNNIIHDIMVTDNYIIFCDTPYQFNITQLLNNRTPFYFDKTKNVDVIYHETTYLKDLHERAALRFHSTTVQAATIAAKANAKRLLIGHFSSRYELLNQFLQEAKEVFPNTDLAIEGVSFRI